MTTGRFLVLRMPDFLAHRPTSTVDGAVGTLAKLGVAGDRVHLVPVGPLEDFRGEIVGQVPVPNAPLEPGTRVTLYVSRFGLSDRLPSGILPPLPTAKDAAMHAIEPGQSDDYWELQVQAHDTGRRFFSVIDQLLQQLHRDLGRVRWALSSLSDDPAFARQSLALVHLDELPLADDEQVLLATMLQRWHEWTGPEGGITTVLSRFLGLPVRVRLTDAGELELPASERHALGDEGCRLGGGLALGPRFADPRPKIQAVVGPLSLADFEARDRDPKWWLRAEKLLEACSPASCRHEIVLELASNDRAARIGDRLRGRLGRTTYLGRS